MICRQFLERTLKPAAVPQMMQVNLFHQHAIGRKTKKVWSISKTMVPSKEPQRLFDVFKIANAQNPYFSKDFAGLSFGKA